VKHIFKKNQIIITVLAVMIAVAGYLQYSTSKLTDEVSPTIAEEDSAIKETETNSIEDSDSAWVDIESLDQDIDTAEGELSDDALTDTVEGEPATEVPGEAVLTSITSGADFAAEAKLSREQVRAKNKETLLEVINNANISEEQKQAAVDSMNNMTEIAEREAAAELLLESKGFANSVVSITDEAADVVISKAELTDAERAQIEDVVKRKTNISGENIVISPMSVE